MHIYFLTQLLMGNRPLKYENRLKEVCVTPDALEMTPGALKELMERNPMRYVNEYKEWWARACGRSQGVPLVLTRCATLSRPLFAAAACIETKALCKSSLVGQGTFKAAAESCDT